MGVAIVLQVAFYRPPSFRQLHGNERTRMQEVKRVDWVGIFLMVAGLFLFLLGISWGICLENQLSNLVLIDIQVVHHCHGRLQEYLVLPYQAALH